MAQFQFNIMDAVGYGYYRVWQERAYLGKLAFFPFLIKLACVIGVYVLGLESNILRQGLILFPAYLAEGWMLAQFLRTLLRDERWPVFVPEQASPDFLTKLLPRARGIIAATLVYTLLELFTNVLRYMAFGNLTPEDMTRMSEEAAKQKAEGDAAAAAGTADFLMFVPSVLLLLGAIWMFRFVWLYIPYAVLMPLRDYLKAVSGFMPSVKMIAVFFCVAVPIMFSASLIMQLFQGGGTSDADPTLQALGDFVGMFIMTIFDMALALVSTAALVWAMRDFLPKKTGLLTLRTDGDQPK